MLVLPSVHCSANQPSYCMPNMVCTYCIVRFVSSQLCPWHVSPIIIVLSSICVCVVSSKHSLCRTMVCTRRVNNCGSAGPHRMYVVLKWIECAVVMEKAVTHACIGYWWVALSPLCSILLPIRCNHLLLPSKGGGCVAATVCVYPHWPWLDALRVFILPLCIFGGVGLSRCAVDVASRRCLPPHKWVTSGSWAKRPGSFPNGGGGLPLATKQAETQIHHDGYDRHSCYCNTRDSYDESEG